MQLQLDEQGHVVVQDGKPVYVDDQGKTTALDHPYTLNTIKRIQGEAKANRERYEAAEGNLKAFEGIEDPEGARKALETVASLAAGDLRRADEVEKIKKEAERAYDDKLKAVDEKYKPVVAERDGLKKALDNEVIGGAFSRSKFIGEKLAIPADMVESKFRGAFVLENGKLVAKDSDGGLIYSRAKPGEVADFDEALEHLVEKYPYRDSILKGSGASGSGAGGSQGAAGGKRTMNRATFDALAPAEKANAVREATIVD